MTGSNCCGTRSRTGRQTSYQREARVSLMILLTPRARCHACRDEYAPHISGNQSSPANMSARLKANEVPRRVLTRDVMDLKKRKNIPRDRGESDGSTLMRRAA